jgi:hypothetical protein
MEVSFNLYKSSICQVVPAVDCQYVPVDVAVAAGAAETVAVGADVDVAMLPAAAWLW